MPSGFRLPRPDGVTPAGRRRWALVAVALVAGAVVLLVLNGGRLARSVGLAGDPGTATVTDCQAHQDGRRREYECHGSFHGADGVVRTGVRFEDSYEHDVGSTLDVRYDGATKMSIEDIATAELTPLFCALAVPLLGLAAMLLVLAIGGRPRTVTRLYRIAGFVLLGGMALVIASLLVLMGAPMSPNT